MEQKRKKWIAGLCGLLLVQPVVMLLFYAGRLPDRYYLRSGETLELATVLPITAKPVAPAASACAVQNTPSAVSLRLFGMLPIKTAEIQQTEEIMLIPCGQAFGIRMLMDGMMAVGFGEVRTAQGACCPAAEAGIQEGDIIQAVNRSPIGSAAAFRAAAAEGKPMLLTVLRGGKTLDITLTPAYSEEEQCWLTGLWVRDSTAGIGTLTYYEPETGQFGGLGHPICDPDTGELIPLASGEADAVTIQGAIRGQAGCPGQLQGYFSASRPIGTLQCNDRCGLFGELYEAPAEIPAIPMALKQEIVLGEAVILSTVRGDSPEMFTVEITDIDYRSDTQNMVIEVTDEALLAATGGIVQGMSGSPILQNGRLIGAVTHVFVSDPSQGYGIFAESMYEVSESIAAQG
jgi:stage IV sporulation protein B